MVEEAVSKPRPDGVSPRRGFGLEIEKSTQSDRRAAASHFSSDGKYVDHGDHCHPNDGVLSDPNFEHQGTRMHVYELGGLVLIGVFLPNTTEMILLEIEHPDSVAGGGFGSAIALDILQNLDPVGVSEPEFQEMLKKGHRPSRVRDPFGGPVNGADPRTYRN